MLVIEDRKCDLLVSSGRAAGKGCSGCLGIRWQASRLAAKHLGLHVVSKAELQQYTLYPYTSEAAYKC